MTILMISVIVYAVVYYVSTFNTAALMLILLVCLFISA